MEARITLLGADGGECSGNIEETTANLSELRTDRKLEPGQLLQLDCGGKILLGEVRACRAAECGYAAQIEVEHVVHSVELSRLLRALLE